MRPRVEQRHSWRRCRCCRCCGRSIAAAGPVWQQQAGGRRVFHLLQVSLQSSRPLRCRRRACCAGWHGCRGLRCRRLALRRSQLVLLGAGSGQEGRAHVWEARQAGCGHYPGLPRATSGLGLSWHTGGAVKAEVYSMTCPPRPPPRRHLPPHPQLLLLGAGGQRLLRHLLDALEQHKVVAA